MPNRIRPGTEDAGQYGADRRRQHDANDELVQLGLAAIENGPCDEENPDIEHNEPGEEQDESAPIERWVDPSVDHRTISAVRCIGHRCLSSIAWLHYLNQLGYSSSHVGFLAAIA
jgi:hypothetical protein